MAWAARALAGMLLVSDRPILHTLALPHSQRTEPDWFQLRGAIESKATFARPGKILCSVCLSQSAATSA